MDEVYQSGKCWKAFSKALGLQKTIVGAFYLQMEETWNSGEPSQQWEWLQTCNNGSKNELQAKMHLGYAAG